MTLQTLIDNKLREFDKKWTRKSKGLEDKGKYRDDWFVKEATISRDVKSFLSQSITQSYEEGREESMNNPKTVEWTDNSKKIILDLCGGKGDCDFEQLKGFVTTQIQKSRQQALEDVNKLLEPEWDDKEMEGKKFNYRRRIGYRDMLRDELREKVKMLKEK
jgi:hypothetical protein